ncbi:hypothetical protein [Streptococcus hyovaginalis]|nr:hypothetical protein [Streptococcus hyovaginalis]MDY5973863.1 hypothetical protein [Streptococcus hyovaginalis]
MPQNAYLFTNNRSAPIAPYFKTIFLLPDKTFFNNTVIDSQAYPVILTEIILNMLHHYPKS